MNVIVDCLHARVGGGLSYALSQLQALQEVRPDIDLTVLAAPVNEEALHTLPRATIVALEPGNVVTRAQRAQRAIRGLSGSADLLYCPGNMVPLLGTGIPVVMAIQNPNYFGPARRRPVNTTIRRRVRRRVSLHSIRRADMVVVISDSLKDAMVHDGVWHDRCVVLHSGTGDLPPVAEPAAVPGDGRPFVLSLANDYEHKHLGLLVEAWGQAGRAAGGTADFPRLVFAGQVTAARRAHLARLARADRADGDPLVFLGPVADRAQVRWLLERAAAMVSCSDLEAFPLTPAEAGAVGCPALLTDIPPHREIASARAHFFPPGDPGALAALLGRAAAGGLSRDPWCWPVSWRDHAEVLGCVFDGVVTGRRPAEVRP